MARVPGTEEVEGNLEGIPVTRDQLEFAISQYLDGTLAADEVIALERQLESDADARQLLAEYRSLNDVMRRELPVPEMNWERLAAHLSEVVAQEELPGRIIRIPWRASAMALAASLLLAVGISVLVMKQHPTTTRPQSEGITEVLGPAAESAAGQPVAEISVGPAESVAQGEYQLSESIVYRPSSVSLIASSDEAAQDTPHALYQR